jgi:hypothetical protein
MTAFRPGDQVFWWKRITPDIGREKRTQLESAAAESGRISKRK